MNLRSPEQYNPPKSASLSRRRRTHSDRRLLVQSTVIPNSRIVRTRRAATLPRHHLVDHRTPEPQTPLSDWDLSHTLQGSISDGRNVQSAHEAKLQTYNLPLRQQVQSLEIASQGPTSDYTADSISISAQDSRFQSERDLGSVHPPSPFVTSSCNLQLERSVTLEQPHARYLDPHDMSTLGYMMTSSHYGMGHYGSTPSSYSPINPPQHASAEQRSSTPGSYSSSYASSPALASDGYFRRQESRAALAPYQPPQSLARSSFQQGPPSDVMRRDSTPLTSSSHNYTYSAPINSSLSSQAPGVSAYPPPQLYPPTTYGVSEYQPLPTMYPPSSKTPAVYPSYESPTSAQPLQENSRHSMSSSPSVQNSAVMPRIVNSRPKPMCWDHGCNGRQFSTFSNLLRHQREKGGTASKSLCPRCGAEFTRTTARNGHMQHDKCKPQRNLGSKQ